MPINTTCPHCGRRYRIHQKYAGRTAPCKSCGKRFQVKDRSAARPKKTKSRPVEYDEVEILDDDDDDVVFDMPRRSPARRTRRRSTFRLPATLPIKPIVITVAILVGLVVLWKGISLVRRVANQIAEVTSPKTATDIEPVFWDASVDTVPATEHPEAADMVRVPLPPATSFQFFPAVPRYVVHLSGPQARDTSLFRVIDLFSGQAIGEIRENPGWEHVVALSPDGRCLAGTSSDEPIQTTVVRLEQSEPVVTLMQCSCLHFLPNERLVTVSPTPVRGCKATIWNLQTGQEIRSFKFPNPIGDRLESTGQSDISPSGRYLAAPYSGHIFVYDLEQGHVAGDIPLPSSRAAGILETDCLQLAFSHDGTRLAGLFRDRGNSYDSRVVCWDMKDGHGMSDFVLKGYSIRPTDQYVTLRWRDDDQAWLCGDNTLIDVETGRILCRYTAEGIFDRVFILGFRDASTLVTKVDGAAGVQDRIECMNVPIDAEQQAIQAMQSDAPAWVRPGQTVGLSISVKARDSSKNAETAKLLRTVLTDRLTALGLTVGDKPTTTLFVQYREMAGHELGILKQDSRPFLHTQDDFTGQTVTGTNVRIEFAWKASPDAKPLWENSTQVDQTSFYIQGDLTKDKVRDAAVKQATQALSRCDIAYFIPKDNPANLLPRIVDVAPADARKRPTPLLQPPKHTGPLDIYAIAQEAAKDATWPPPLVTTDLREPAAIETTQAKYPPLSKPTATALTPVPATKENERWQPTIDAAPRSTRMLAEVPVPVDGYGQIKQVFFSEPSAGRVVLQRTNGSPSAAEDQLVACDLFRCKTIGQWTLPDRITLLDCNADGTLALGRLHYGAPDEQLLSTQKRLDIWSMEDGSHIAGWMPYANASGADAVPTSAVFTDGNHVATLNAAGRMVLWTVPECKAVYAIDSAGDAPLITTPGRKYVGIYRGRSLRFFDAATGQSRGDLVAPTERPGRVAAVAFDETAKQMVAHIKSPEDQLVQWNLESGQSEWDCPLPRSAAKSINLARFFQRTRLQWCRTGHIMFDNFIIDPAQRGVVWQFVSALPVPLLIQSPDERQWFLIGKALVPLSMFDDKLVAQLKSAKALVKPIAGPGTAVSLKMKLSGKREERGDFDYELIRSIGRQLAINGMSCKPNQPITLAIVTHGGTTGESFTYRSDSSESSETYRVRQHELDCDIGYIGKDDTVYWMATITQQSRSSFIRSIMGGKSVVSTFEAEDRAKLWLTLQENIQTDLRLPSYLFSTQTEKGIGTTKIDEEWVKSIRTHLTGPLANVPTREPSSAVTAQGYRTEDMMFSPTSNSEFATCGDRVMNAAPLKVWDVEKKRLIHPLQFKETLTTLTYSPNGQSIAAADRDGHILLFSLRQGRRLPRMLPSGADYDVTAFAWSPDGETILAGMDNGIIGAWAAKKKEEGTLIKKFGDDILSLQYLPDGGSVIAFIADRTVRQVTLESRTHRDLAIDVGCCAVSRDGTTLAVGSANYSQTGVTLIDIATLESKDKIAVSVKATALAISPDDNILAIGGRQGLVVLWDIHTANPLLLLTGHQDDIEQLTFSLDGNILAARARSDGRILFWKLDSLGEPPAE